MYHNHHLHETKHLKEANLLQEEKYRHLTADPVGKLVCEMAVPTIISMLVTAVYNLADTFFVGLMRSNAATGAVGVVFSLMAIIQATGFFFGQGSGNYISRQLGRHQTEDAETMAITAVTLAFSAGVVLLVLGQDLLMILFCQAFSALCLVIAAMSVRSPYSWIGSQRKILQMLAYEPTLVLLILAVYLRTDSFMGCKVLESGTPLIYSMPLLFVSLLCVICIEFEKSPFDVASSHHAHQEIVKGTMLEFSGPFLGLIELAHAYEMAIFFGLMVAFWHTSLIMGIVLAFFGFLMVLVRTNADWQFSVAPVFRSFIELSALYPSSPLMP